MGSWNNSNFNWTEHSNATAACLNDYCVSEEEYVAMIEDYIFPTFYEWILITCHAIVFIFGTVGNAAVCILVYRNHTMRTVTNIFLANLAVADFMVIVLCLPPSVVWDVTYTWFFGGAMCKIVLYLQSVSVAVSVLTLTFITVDRWYGICYPLQFKTSSTKVKPLIVIIWIVSLLLVLPEAIFLDAHPHNSLLTDSVYFTDCNFTWTKKSSIIYQIYITLTLYVIPLILILVLYYQIVKTLWRSATPGSAEVSQKEFSSSKSKKAAREMNMKDAFENLSCKAQIRSRRKAAKMLMCVAFMFGLCYLPVHVINILRYALTLSENDITTVASLIAHWLCYANSAINPVIYNIMNGQFRKEFRNLFRISCTRKGYFSHRSSSNSSRGRYSRTLSTQYVTINRTPTR